MLPLALLGLTLHAVLVGADVLPHYDALVLVPLVVLFARGLAGRAAPRRFWLTLLVFVIFGAGLYAHQLRFGYAGRHALVGGVIPWSDADGFLSNAWRLLHGMRSTVRPVFVMTFAATLGVVGHDVRIAVCVYALVIALVMSAVVTRLGERYGWKAFAGILVVFLFILRRNGFVLATESVGLVAGLVAFEAFASCLGEDVRGGLLLPAGFFVLGLALMARPGPFLAIPLVLAWLQYRGRRWKLTAACAVAFGLAFATNLAIVKTTAEPGQQVGLEFPAILYGAMHGEDYTELCIRNKDVCSLPPGERRAAVLRRMGEEIAARPWLPLGFLQGAVAFVGSPHGQLSLLLFDPDDQYFERVPPLEGVRRAGIYRTLNLAGIALLAVGLVALSWRALWRRRKATERDLLAECAQVVFLGAMLSACVTPPWITEAAQLQTTTLGFFALLPWTYDREKPRPIPLAARRVWTEQLALVGALAAAWLFVLTRSNDVPTCTADAHVVHTEPSTLVRARDAGEGGYTLARMTTNLERMKRHNPRFVGPLLALVREGVAFTMVFDACAGRGSVLVGDAAMLAALPPGWTTIPGTQADEDGRIFRIP